MSHSDIAHLSRDRELISQWAEEVLSLGLYRTDGIAQEVFRHPEEIQVMVYMPGVAWSMYSSLKCLHFDYLRTQTFVRPDMRRKGIGTFLFNLIQDSLSPESSKW